MTNPIPDEDLVLGIKIVAIFERGYLTEDDALELEYTRFLIERLPNNLQGQAWDIISQSKIGDDVIGKIQGLTTNDIDLDNLVKYLKIEENYDKQSQEYAIPLEDTKKLRDTKEKYGEQSEEFQKIFREIMSKYGDYWKITKRGEKIAKRLFERFVKGEKLGQQECLTLYACYTRISIQKDQDILPHLIDELKDLVKLRFGYTDLNDLMPILEKQGLVKKNPNYIDKFGDMIYQSVESRIL